jgi:hypothetical protein
MYFSALLRGLDHPSPLGLVGETIDVTAVALFAVFEMAYVTWDGAGSAARDVSLGMFARKGQMEKLRYMLAAREAEELKAGLRFE